MDQKKRLIELLCAVECKGDDRRKGGCGFRQDNRCNCINKLDMCMIECIADNLLANSTKILPVKVGQVVYVPWGWDEQQGVVFVKIQEIKFYDYQMHYMFLIDLDGDDECFNQSFGGWKTEQSIGKTVFLTIEEAEKALAERSRS